MNVKERSSPSNDIQSDNAPNVPLCVDLDGTLVRTDLLLESLAGLLVRNALLVFLLPFWLFKGKARLKSEIASRVDLDAETLPYNMQLLDYLKDQQAKGRPLVLTTASHEKYAHQVARFLGIFDEIIASDSVGNNAGTRKRDTLVCRFQTGGFDYAGNSKADFSIWVRARQAIIVNSGVGLERRLLQRKPDSIVFRSNRRSIGDYVSVLRVHQWSKNLLLFVPLVAAHQVTEVSRLSDMLIGFVSFCLCASAIYVINDFCDISADRRHETKKNRLFASGNLPIGDGLILAVTLLVVGLGFGLFLQPAFTSLLATYVIGTIAYSVYIKSLLLVDVILLAGLYTLRIMAGGAASGVDVSFWLFTFSLFLFLSLAILKRYAEIQCVNPGSIQPLPGRGYQVSDRYLLQQIGIAAGVVSVMVLALYIDSDTISRLYTNPTMMWLLCPLVLYWIARIWILAGRGRVQDDPVLFALRDRISYLLVGAVLALLWVAA
jgi:4-hydroxybenzoate polyprenyltransferase